MALSLDSRCFGEFQNLIHELTGITIADDRKSLVEGRFRNRVKKLKLSSYSEYLRFVQSDVSEQKTLVELITTNETYCFRTPRVWNFLQETFLPEWYRHNIGHTFRAWSAAASSGEEAHSLGVLCEAFKFDNPAFKYEILGTDISRTMIERCQAGKYSGRSIRMFRETRPEWFSKFMHEVDSDQFCANNEIRGRLRFEQHNLFDCLKRKGPFDLVLLRNVLIYFTPGDQEKVLANISPQLATNGLLIIGESESLAHISSDFRKKATYIYEAEQSTPASSEQ